MQFPNKLMYEQVHYVIVRIGTYISVYPKTGKLKQPLQRYDKTTPTNTLKPSQWFSRKALKQPSRLR
jgi:hypothetical protein